MIDCCRPFSSSSTIRSFWGSSSNSAAKEEGQAKEESKAKEEPEATSSPDIQEPSKAEGGAEQQEPAVESAEELRAQLDGIKEAEAKLKEQVRRMHG